MDPKCDPITKARSELPIRYGGCGLTSQVGIGNAARVGCIALLLTKAMMLDRVDELGDITKGFMNSLDPILGKGSFNHGSVEPRFHYLINDSGHPLGRQLQDDWRRMQRVAFPGSPTTCSRFRPQRQVRSTASP